MTYKELLEKQIGRECTFTASICTVSLTNGTWLKLNLAFTADLPRFFFKTFTCLFEAVVTLALIPLVRLKRNGTSNTLPHNPPVAAGTWLGC